MKLEKNLSFKLFIKQKFNLKKLILTIDNIIFYKKGKNA